MGWRWRGHILAGDAEYVLVIGAETLSRIVDWTDRNTCVLFGDGAEAVLVAASDVPGGIMATEAGATGQAPDMLIVPAGGSAPGQPGTVSNGSTSSRWRQSRFPLCSAYGEATTKALSRAGLTTDDVDLVIPHQANLRIMQNSVLRQLKFRKIGCS